MSGEIWLIQKLANVKLVPLGFLFLARVRHGDDGDGKGRARKQNVYDIYKYSRKMLESRVTKNGGGR